MHVKSAVTRMAILGGAALVSLSLSAWTPPHGSRVLTVGSYQGKPGMFTSIQAAVDHAKPGDWILIGPGDYHETADGNGPQGDPGRGQMGGVYVTTPNLHLRGMDRNTVVVDGTRPGSSQCSSNPADQFYGAPGAGGAPVGRNGILVWKADDVTIENLTACNFLAGTGDSGNQIWWNGGAGTGQIGMQGYWGNYLTATSTFYSSTTSASQYGIFASNAAGPASFNELYANNMDDSGMYVGACQQACDVTINHAWMQYNALGYSGTNSLGTVVIENSQFDHNQDGVDTNTQIHGDAPAPQNGTCQYGAVSPITHTHSCWVFIHNYVHDNNDPNNPALGEAAAGPVGTGMTVTGGTHDTVMDNVFANNGAWGILFLPFPDPNPPSNHQTCSGAGGHPVPGFGCVLDPKADALLSNTFYHDGFFGNPTNSDFGQITFFGHEPQNCFRSNIAPNGSAPANLEQVQPRCGVLTTAGEHGRRATTRSALRHSLERLPAWLQLPPADRHRTSPATDDPAEHARSLPGGAGRVMVWTDFTPAVPSRSDVGGSAGPARCHPEPQGRPAPPSLSRRPCRRSGWP